MAILRLAWHRFNVIGSIIGDVQSRVIVIGFYFTVLVPFALLARLAGDPLHIRRAAGIRWLERPPIPEDIDSARQQG